MDREPGPESRRRRAPLVVAGCVLALALAGGIAAVVLDDDSPAKPRPAELVGPDTSPLVLGRLKNGEPPTTDYVRDTHYVRDGEFGFSFGYRDHHSIEPVNYALMDGGYLVEDRIAGSPHAFFVRFDQTRTEMTWPLSGGFAVEPGGATGAFLTPTGFPIVIQEGGASWSRFARIPGPGPYAAVALNGDACTGPMTNCALLVRSGTAPGRTWLVRGDGVTVPADLGVAGAVTIAGDGTVAGLVPDGGPHCSAVASKGRRLWRTCVSELHAFSPDSRLVLGTTIRAGGAATDLSVFEAGTGRTLLHLRAGPRLTLRHLRWEDREHVLALVREAVGRRQSVGAANYRWAVLRISLDGHREYAVAPSTQVRDRAPIILPVN